MAEWAMCISRGIATPKKAEASPLFAFLTNGMPKMRWTPWTAPSWMDGSCGFRWPDMADPPIPTTVGGDEGRQINGGAEATPPAPGTSDAAGPAAGAVPVPAAGPATVNPGPGHAPTHQLATANPGLAPRPAPSPLLPRTRRRRPSLNPGPSPRARPRPPRESPHPDLQASPSLRQRMEAEPRRSLNRRRKNFTPRTGFPIYTYLSSSKRLFFCVFASFIWPLIVFFPFLMVGFVLFFLSVYICHVINTRVDFCSLQLPRCWVHFNLLIT